MEPRLTTSQGIAQSGWLEPVNQAILSQLGEYLLAHRDEIIGEWLRGVERNPRIESSDHLAYNELVDHLPDLCEQLAQLLRNAPADPDLAEVSRRARVHGTYRFRQGYKLDEVIREASIVRRILFYNWVDAFACKVPEFTGPTRRTAENIIHQAVDDVITDSTSQFVQEQQKTTAALNSELGDALAELRQQTAAAVAANNAKDRFLAMLSHELRTPLNPILLWTSATLGENGLPPDVREGIEMVRRNVELEVGLIDDLLDIARITGGKLQLNLQLSDAASVLRDAVEMVRAESEKKKLQLHVELKANDHLVVIDRTRLQQVFWNLLQNAQKFTPEGGSIWIRSFNDADRKVIFEISDSGKGIEPELLPRIFDAFAQGAAPEEGLGLGLAISKAIVELHGGRIRAFSKGPGMGSTFTIQLNPPRDGAAEPVIASE